MYFGDPKHPISRKPSSPFRRTDPEKEQLAEQNALLKKLLRQQTEDETPRARRNLGHIRRAPRIALVGMVLVLVVAVGGVYHFYTQPHKHSIGSTSAFPTSVEQEIQGFKLYYLKPSFQTDFVLQPDSVQLQDGVLVFGMKNSSGESLAFTEERTPPNFDTSSLLADQQFNTEYGQAFITNGDFRTTGAVFTHDNTWILINAPKPIGTSAMTQIINALTPTT